jgi:hypothetical protein
MILADSLSAVSTSFCADLYPATPPSKPSPEVASANLFWFSFALPLS